MFHRDVLISIYITTEKCKNSYTDNFERKITIQKLRICTFFPV